MFIVFEGVDGAGKSTLIKGLTKELDARQQKYVVTREPGGTPLGEELRQILLRKEGDIPTPRAELLLYQAIRAHHVEQTIKPQLACGNWVLCDRFTDSSLAFQAGGRGLDPQPIIWLNQYATQGLKPDLVVLLDLDPRESFHRIRKRESEGQDLDRFEAEQENFHQRVRDYYIKLSQEAASPWLVLDAKNPPEHLKQILFDDLLERKWLV